MTVDISRLEGLRTLCVARLALDGQVRKANPAFARALGFEGLQVGENVSARFFSPTFAELRARAQQGRDPVHDGTVDVGPPGVSGTTMRALVARKGDELVFLGEVDEPAYHLALDEVVSLNDELAQLQREQRRTIERLERTERELREALAQVRTLRGLLPICARCKKIKNDAGTWERLESYVERHSEAQLSHGLCQDCLALGLAELDEQPPP